MAHEFSAHLAGLIQSLRDTIPQIGLVDHFLHVPQLLGPRAEIRSSDRPFRNASGPAAAPIVRSGVATSARQFVKEVSASVSASLLLPALLLATLLLTALLIGGLLLTTL